MLLAILIARNRSGRSTDFVPPIDNAACISEVLRQAVAADCVLCTDGTKQFEAAARTLGLEHQAVNIVRGERIRGAWHIQNVNAYHGRFKQWMRRFKTWPRPTCLTISDGSVHWTETPNLAQRLHRCSLWLFVLDGILSEREQSLAETAGS